MDVSRDAAVFETPSKEDVEFAAGVACGTELPNSRTIRVERVSSQTMTGYLAAWADLAARSMETNIFLEPAFVLPLIQHVERHRRPEFLLVWAQEHPSADARLIGLLPLGTRRWLGGARVVPCFTNKQTVGGVPLLDREMGRTAFVAMLAWLGDQVSDASALLIHGVALDGAFYAMVSRSGFKNATYRHRERAILKSVGAPAPAIHPMTSIAPALNFGSAKRRKELRRQWRRLSDAGDRRYTSARSSAEIAKATEHFLALELKGWKGDCGTALLASPNLATFARTMTRLMALEGKCRIDAIEIDGRAVAMGIILTVNGRSHFWKTTFDETYASRSPGVQFTLELTDAQLANEAIAVTDSCAVPDHPMIDRIWSERMPVADLLIDLRPADLKGFPRAVKQEGRLVVLHDALKRIYVLFRGGKAR